VTDRPALDAARIQLAAPWSRLDVVAETESTNADLLAMADAPDGAVLVAEYQRGGRGRMGRSWQSPPRAGVTCSVLLRPPVSTSCRPWLSLLAGVALCAVAPTPAALKWPNDVLVNGRKVGGVLSQATVRAVVLGIGVNVSTTPAELPVPTATSFAIEGVEHMDRTAFLAALLATMGRRYLDWLRADGDAEASGLAAEYRSWCATIGQEVAISTTGGTGLRGVATGIDSQGRLLVWADGADHAVAAGDVEHLHPGSG
jgi:BirA family transcriptional regulator, biotin operon repressor / biotin---[acetyl-CoA-carboxylase] ligase